MIATLSDEARREHPAPSPLTGEGWDRGDSFANGRRVRVTSSFILPSQGGEKDV